MSATIPETYAEWRRCIEVDCGLTLTPDFITTRLTVLSQPAHQDVQRFANLYGQAHLARVRHWFEQARQTAPAH